MVLSESEEPSVVPSLPVSSNNINQWMDEEVELVDKKGRRKWGRIF
jgi:hypothetical protein